MLNILAKTILVSTSMSPILGAVAVNQLAQGHSWRSWAPWLIAAIGLALICWLMLHYVQKVGEEHKFCIKQFENTDREVLMFLLTYLLPFIASDNLNFNDGWITGAYILLVIFFTIAHAGAFHFNPVMGLFKYHFYSVKDADGVSYLLISKQSLRRSGQEVQAVMLSDGIYLNRYREDA